ncbi:hypothetical protein FA13DRAFT_1723519 [Coprinellus micaceus]|uniref:Uncharacterized protein n=1 Tax=Coprinellus micaceus TaxID=71717 RepID=A0A4Y7R5G4_COPMI|nr:hypothetical protein FA13DRAFT_1723519 [Coprinellus micaceus]
MSLESRRQSVPQTVLRGWLGFAHLVGDGRYEGRKNDTERCSVSCEARSYEFRKGILGTRPSDSPLLSYFAGLDSQSRSSMRVDATELAWEETRGREDERDVPMLVSPKAQSDDKSKATFERLAIVISVYKVARYSWETVEKDEDVSWEERMLKRRNLEDAYRDLLWFIERSRTLPPSSRRQLSILYYETQGQELHKRLQPRYLSLNKRRRFHNDSSDTDSDGDEFCADSDDDENRPFPYHDDPFSALCDPFSRHDDSEPDSP